MDYFLAISIDMLNVYQKKYGCGHVLLKVIDIWITQSREAIGEFNRRPVGTTCITRTKSQLVHLFSGRISQFATSVPGIHVPQARQPIDQAIAVGIDQV